MDIILNTAHDEGDNSLEKAPSPVPFFQNLLNRMNPDASAGVISLLAHYYGFEGRWIGITPIHWQATHNDSTIVAYGDSLNLSEANARSYLAQLSLFLRDDSPQFYYHSPSVWLMKADNKPKLNSPSPEYAVHRSLMPMLEVWDKTLYWVRLFTEIQMFFASAQVQHGESSDMPVNGVWLWGDMPLTPIKRRLVSNDHRLVKNLSAYINTAFLEIGSFQPCANDIIALNPVEVQYTSMLESALATQSCNYIYNNHEVIKKPVPWPKRLWRKLK